MMRIFSICSARQFAFAELDEAPLACEVRQRLKRPRPDMRDDLRRGHTSKPPALLQRKTGCETVKEARCIEIACARRIDKALNRLRCNRNCLFSVQDDGPLLAARYRGHRTIAPQERAGPVEILGLVKG